MVLKRNKKRTIQAFPLKRVFHIMMTRLQIKQSDNLTSCSETAFVVDANLIGCILSVYLQKQSPASHVYNDW